MSMDNGYVGFRRAQARQETNKSNALSVAARPQVLSGQIQINGSGDSIVNIPFPIQFSQKPILSFGGDLEHGQSVTIGSLPTVSMIVTRWDIVGSPPLQLFYQGATVAIVTSGVDDQIMYAHYTFTGVALSNPTNGNSSSLEAPI